MVKPGNVRLGMGMTSSTVNLRVPLIWSGQGRFALPAGQVVDDLVGLMDVAPTLLGAWFSRAPFWGRGVICQGFGRGEAPQALPPFCGSHQAWGGGTSGCLE